MARYNSDSGEVVEAFEYGVEPRPAWYDKLQKEYTFDTVEPVVGCYIVLFGNDRLVRYSPDLFEQQFEPIVN